MMRFKLFSIMALISSMLFLSACGTSETKKTNDEDVTTTEQIQKDADTVIPSDNDSVVPSDNDSVVPSDSDSEVPDNDSPTTAKDNTIEKIQKGEIAEDTAVTTKVVVVAVDYVDDKTTHEPTGIKGLYVSEVIAQAKPYTGIFVHFKTAEAVDAYKMGDYIEVSGTYKEYYDASQIEATDVSKLGTKPIPAPAVISDPSKVSTPFEKSGTEWKPTTTSGADAEKYESVLVKVENVEVTNNNLGHGMWEVTGHLAIDKELHYYKGDRNIGVKFKSIQGVLVYSFEAFKLAPRQAEDLVEDASSEPTDGDVNPDSDSGEVPDVDSGDDSQYVTTINAIQSGTKEAGNKIVLKQVTVISTVKESTGTEGNLYSFYVSDGTSGNYSGLYIYKLPSSDTIAKGDVVTLKGQVAFYGKQWEIKSAKDFVMLKKNSSGGTIPAAVTISKYPVDDKMKGSLIKITGAKVKAVADKYGAVELENGLFITTTFAGKDAFASLKVGDTLDATGIYDVAFGKTSIMPLETRDVVKK